MNTSRLIIERGKNGWNVEEMRKDWTSCSQYIWPNKKLGLFVIGAGYILTNQYAK